MKLYRIATALAAILFLLAIPACETEQETVTTTTVTKERSVQPGTTTETHVQRAY